MWKFVLCLLATLMVLGIVARYAGASWMGTTAVTVPHFGWPLTWAFLLFAGVMVICWKVAHGK